MWMYMTDDTNIEFAFLIDPQINDDVDAQNGTATSAPSRNLQMVSLVHRHRNRTVELHEAGSSTRRPNHHRYVHAGGCHTEIEEVGRVSGITTRHCEYEAQKVVLS